MSRRSAKRKAENDKQEKENTADDEEEGDESEEVLERKILPKRSTRGLRLSVMDGEGDEEFWAQDFFQEEPDDGEYESESEEDDVVDSDFDVDEDENEEEVVVVKEKKKRKRGYVDPANKRQKVAKAPKAKAVAPARSNVPNQIRKSSRAATVEKAEAMKARERERKKKPAKVRAVPVFQLLSQEARLKEAKEVEIVNTKSLEDLLRLEEEKKDMGMRKKPVIEGPGVLTISKGGRTEIVFTRVEAIPAIFDANPPTKPQRQVCVITGLPAKYWDRVTRKPYATVDAFKTLRAEHDRLIEHKKQQQKQAKLKQKQAKTAAKSKNNVHPNAAPPMPRGPPPQPQAQHLGVKRKLEAVTQPAPPNNSYN